MAVAPVKTLAEIFLFLHNNTSAAAYSIDKKKFRMEKVAAIIWKETEQIN